MNMKLLTVVTPPSIYHYFLIVLYHCESSLQKLYKLILIIKFHYKSYKVKAYIFVVDSVFHFCPILPSLILFWSYLETTYLCNMNIYVFMVGYSAVCLCQIFLLIVLNSCIFTVYARQLDKRKVIFIDATPFFISDTI